MDSACDRPPPAEPLQFENGLTITVAEKEFVPFLINLTLPKERITWYLELDITTGESTRQLRVDNNGHDFFSPGSRELNEYSTGFAVDSGPWGVDTDARVLSEPVGSGVLEYRGPTVRHGRCVGHLPSDRRPRPVGLSVGSE